VCSLCSVCFCIFGSFLSEASALEPLKRRIGIASMFISMSAWLLLVTQSFILERRREFLSSAQPSFELTLLLLHN
jgi:hypothetical protein